MTDLPVLSQIDPSVVPAMLIGATRCWRAARDNGQSVQPPLAQALSGRNCMILAPVFDSLYLFYEGALGRSLIVGTAMNLSADESLLLALIEGRADGRCLNCSTRAAEALDCALCSTRVMLALTLTPRETGTLQ